MRSVCSTAVLIISLAGASASAQQVPFERAFDVGPGPTVDVTTIRGKITVTVGDETRVRVMGTATVRIGFNVPANALDLAKRLASNPPIERDGETIRLRPPATAEERRAVTVSYDVRVPRNTRVRSSSDSGDTNLTGVGGPVDVHTQSSTIELQNLGGAADVTTQSGSVTASDVAGRMSVRTGSSSITLRGLGGGLQARTQSGAVDAAFRGPGDVDVETASSGVELAGVQDGLRVVTKSGRVRVTGTPAGPWAVETGSGAVDLDVARNVGFNLDAASRSSQVRLDGLSVNGAQAKGLARGTVGAGGPVVRVTSRSGSIDIRAR